MCLRPQCGHSCLLCAASSSPRASSFRTSSAKVPSTANANTPRPSDVTPRKFPRALGLVFFVLVLVLAVVVVASAVHQEGNRSSQERERAPPDATLPPRHYLSRPPANSFLPSFHQSAIFALLSFSLSLGQRDLVTHDDDDDDDGVACPRRSS